VVATLWKGPLRFNELKRTVGGVSQKMLSKTVRGLERDGLISRTAFATVPVTVEYAITPLGETLAKTMDALRIWSADHIGEVVGARAAFDAAPSGYTTAQVSLRVGLGEATRLPVEKQ